MASTNSTAEGIARTASSASYILKAVAGSERNAALTAVYKHLQAAKDEIIEANRKDMAAAEEQAVAGKLSRSMIKRLDLSKPGKWEDMLQGILDVRDLEDPGEDQSTRFNRLYLDPNKHPIISWKGYFSY